MNTGFSSNHAVFRLVRAKGLEPLHQRYWLLRPARLPFRHARISHSIRFDCNLSHCIRMNLYIITKAGFLCKRNFHTRLKIFQTRIKSLFSLKSQGQNPLFQHRLRCQHGAQLAAVEVQTTLHPDCKRLAQGRIRRKLDGSPERKRAGRHNDLTVIALSLIHI